jgi:Flp pilus assembly protein TadG
VRSDRGTTVVEFALILPILVMLIFGIVEFGRGYNAKITVTHAAREGARVLALTADPDAAEIAVKNAATSLDPGAITVTSSACSPGTPASVTVQYPFSYEVPLVGGGTETLSATGVMRCTG